jgi:hypothetical protein
MHDKNIQSKTHISDKQLPTGPEHRSFSGSISIDSTDIEYSVEVWDVGDELGVESGVSASGAS